MNADEIRCESDRSLFNSLLADSHVRRVNELLARREEEGPMGVRRRLLSTSVRLSRRMAPQVHDLSDACIEQLGLDIPLELFVYSSAQFNAACFKPEAGRLYVMFSSSLLEAFSGSELRFVIGHELGHHVYRHHDVPIGLILGGQQGPSPRLALDLFAWSRYAEISADRAGALCARDLEGVARALFQLASGLTEKTIEFNLEDFLSQVDDMQIDGDSHGAGAPQEDWFATHPFSPLRVKALQLFHESALMTQDGASRSDLEVGVQRLLSLMEPSYIEGRTDIAEAMRRLLYVGAIAVANVSDGITPGEVAVFEKFFGEGSFSNRLNIEALLADLPQRTARLRELATPAQCMQVLRDLCVVARAEGKSSAAERAILDGIADGLSISRAFVCQTLAADCEPD